MENDAQKEANLPTLNWDKLVPFRPILTPYNDAARQCLSELFNQLDGPPTTEVRKAKYEIVLGSFLAAAQSVSSNRSRSSTLRRDSGNRTYIITAKWMISGLVLK